MHLILASVVITLQPLANARRYGYKDICTLLEAKGGFVKVLDYLTVTFSWLGLCFYTLSSVYITTLEWCVSTWLRTR